jgi:ferric-dicitrate binding protein FerR (iron transport regulator)
MNHSIHRLSVLSFKFLQEELNETERMELQHFLDQSEENRLLFNGLTNRARINEDLEHLSKMDSKTVWETVVKANPELKKGRVVSFFLPTVKYAAAVMLIAGLGGYWVLSRSKNKAIPKKETAQISVNNDVAPGQYKAKLTLADGSTVILDSVTANSQLQQGGTKLYAQNGQLVYEQKVKQKEVLYNTLTTAKGEMYAMLLSDGSKVWLNSQTSIRYPVVFNDNVRKVEVTGEAYFEVAPSVSLLPNGEKGKRPFIVKANGMEVEVLGTHFNINSYSNEDAIKATLLEGKVRVHSAAGNAESILSPGEQAILKRGPDNRIAVVKDVDVDEVVAWKNGYFQFTYADLQAVLRELERWYDVDVQYDGAIPARKFLGKIPRNSNLSQVLATLELNNVHFKLEGKRIIVMP